MSVCLDSWAVLRWLEGSEPAAARVDEVLQDRPVMSWVNVGEVFYIVHRSAGPERATRVVEHLRARIFLDEATPRRVLDAAAIKAVHPMAYADAFALATAQAHGAVLLTGDPEILGAGGDWRVEDLRG
jgi:predicted nucleic acid-binding protein